MAGDQRACFELILIEDYVRRPVGGYPHVELEIPALDRTVGEHRGARDVAVSAVQPCRTADLPDGEVSTSPVVLGGDVSRFDTCDAQVVLMWPDSLEDEVVTVVRDDDARVAIADAVMLDLVDPDGRLTDEDHVGQPMSIAASTFTGPRQRRASHRRQPGRQAIPPAVDAGCGR